MMQGLRKNWLLVSNMTWGIWWTSTQPLRSLKTSLRWALLSKVYEVWAEKIQRSYLSWNWTVMQNLNKLWPCGFKNGMRDGWNFIRAHNSLKIVHWWAFFVQSTLYFCLVWALRSPPQRRTCLIFMRAVERLEMCT